MLVKKSQLFSVLIHNIVTKFFGHKGEIGLYYKSKLELKSVFIQIFHFYTESLT